jgi:hypothetical protein
MVLVNPGTDFSSKTEFSFTYGKMKLKEMVAIMFVLKEFIKNPDSYSILILNIICTVLILTPMYTV